MNWDGQDLCLSSADCGWRKHPDFAARQHPSGKLGKSTHELRKSKLCGRAIGVVGEFWCVIGTEVPGRIQEILSHCPGAPCSGEGDIMNVHVRDFPSPVTLTDEAASMRQIHPRSSVSNRGYVIVPVPGQPGRRKRVHFESRLEQKVVYLLLARPDVVDVVEQQRIMLPRGDGQTPHTLDLLALTQDGTRIGVLVKPWKYAQRDNVKAQITALRAHAVPRHADRFVVITDRDFTPVQVRNAELLHLARMSSDAEADSTVAAFATDLFGEVRIDRMIAATSLGSRGFRAIVRAIGAGVLQPANSGLIDLHSTVRKGKF